MDFLRRIIVAAAVLLIGSASAQAGTTDGCPSFASARTQCESYIANFLPNNPGYPFSCFNDDYTPVGDSIGRWQCKNKTGAVCGNYSYNCAAHDPGCTVGGNSQSATVDGEESTICNNACVYQCKAADGGACFSFDLNNGQGFKTTGTWAQTGQTCGTNDPEEPEPTQC